MSDDISHLDFDIEEDPLGDGPVCPTCGVPLTPRPEMIDGHPGFVLYCAQDGDVETWNPLAE